MSVGGHDLENVWGLRVGGHGSRKRLAPASTPMTNLLISASGQLPLEENSGEVITWGSVLEVMALEKASGKENNVTIKFH